MNEVENVRELEKKKKKQRRVPAICQRRGLAS